MIKQIGVVGAGQMGAGIAQVAAVNGFSVVLSDVGDTFLDNGMGRIQKSLSILVKKDRINEEEKNTALGRIATTVDIKALESVDFVVEAVIENESLKLDTDATLHYLTEKKGL